MVRKTADTFQRVMDALKDADNEEVNRIFNAIIVLRGISPSSLLSGGTSPAPAGSERPSGTVRQSATGSGADRPKALGELLREKTPASNPQKILTYAYYLDKHEGKQRFSRDNLSKFYVEAREQPDKNFNRDVRRLVQAGLIHEAGDNSYITSTGIEAVESNFAAMKPGPRKGTTKSSKAKQSKKQRS